MDVNFSAKITQNFIAPLSKRSTERANKMASNLQNHFENVDELEIGLKTFLDAPLTKSGKPPLYVYTTYTTEPKRFLKRIDQLPTLKQGQWESVRRFNNRVIKTVEQWVRAEKKIP